MTTIAAIATPPGTGGIGIIKISGPDALKIANAVFRSKAECRDRKRVENSFYECRDRKRVENSFYNTDAESGKRQSHHLYHGCIADDADNRIIDEVLLTLMFAPHSYTREDVAEIQAHSGPAVLRAILELVLKKGAVLAEPGEFTKRAYLNGRIDLTQAEAVMDIVAAKTEKSLEIAAAQIRGGMKKHIESVRDDLIGILTETEAAIDFPEDAGETLNADAITEILENRVIRQLKVLLSQYENARFLREGLSVLIAGKPNVGKSSLMNCLLQKDRAIVTPVPGTTRDIIEETLNIRGIPVILTDTAGLHESRDPVEILGIKKTREGICQADLILFMVDSSEPLTATDEAVYESIRHKKLILLANKSDLRPDNFKLDIPDSWGKIPLVNISALYERGLDELKDLIAEAAGCFHTESPLIPNLRHKSALERSFEAVSAAADAIKASMPFELVSIDLQEAIDALGEIIGITVKPDVLDQIFSRFCIGK